MTPTVSVLMPVFKARRYVGEAIESILTQTFSDFEFLIIDDGSTDDSLKILERYARSDARIRLVSRSNRGLVQTLSELTAMARGEFLARMDADDVAVRNRFSLQTAFLREHPEVVCVGGQVLEIDGQGWDLGERYELEIEDGSIQERLLAGYTCINHPSAMMRRDAVEAVGGYDVQWHEAEDLDLWLRLGEYGRLANLPDVVTHYRVHGKSKFWANHEAAIEAARAISDAACQRRGINRRFEPREPCRGEDEGHRSMRLGWVGLSRGHRQMAMHYAIRAVQRKPLQRQAWQLLACSLFKPLNGEAKPC